MDLDSILMALYCIGYADGMRFATPEPLGPGGDPYPAMFNKPDEQILDRLVGNTAHYFPRGKRQSRADRCGQKFARSMWKKYGDRRKLNMLSHRQAKTA